MNLTSNFLLLTDSFHNYQEMSVLSYLIQYVLCTLNNTKDKNMYSLN